MGLFNRNNDNNTTEDGQSYEDKYEIVEIAEVRKSVTKEAEYTEHTAEVHYPNGDVEEIVFDKMRRDSDVIILSDYKDYTPKTTTRGCGMSCSFAWHGGFEAEKFATLPLDNFRKFETVNRRDASMEYEVTETETKKLSEVEDDEEVVETWNKEVRK